MAVINFKVLPASSAAASAAAVAANSIYNCHMMAMGRPELKNCWNCEGEMSHSHQCEAKGDTSLKSPPAPHPLYSCSSSLSAKSPLGAAAVTSSLPWAKVPGPSAPIILKKHVKKLDGSGSVVEEHPLPLPLCHYCCHRGSGDKPVHYYQQCLCRAKVCSCHCYCDEEQLEHRKLFFQDGFSGSMVPVALKDRPEAKLVAEKRLGQWPIFPCESDDCARPP